jgi:fumarate hydratase class II
MAATRTRIERDSMGEMMVPAEAYWAAQTARALDAFHISELRFGRRFIKALGLIKQAAARVNVDLGELEPRIGEAIVGAAAEVAEGMLDREFVLDVFQTGSGTSTNMNANEVIASRAIEILGGKRGDKKLVHPNDHVNKGQSTNDTFPTAIHLAALDAIATELKPALKKLAEAWEEKAREFGAVVKSGRTHLQDAVPVTLGQEFSGYADVVRQGSRRLAAAEEALQALPIGATALGTGLNAHPEYAERMITALRALSGLNVRRASNLFEAMQNRDACLETSAALKMLAVGLMKMANDLRLLASGPRTGFAEIELPAIQPGSSIMPGKVNPVVPEAVNMVAAKVIGNDATLTVAGLNGNLDLNVMMPIIAHSLLESIEITAAASGTLAEKCVRGIRADVERCREYAERSVALVTAVAPVIGYDAAAAAAKQALAEGKSVRRVLLDQGFVNPEQVDEILNLERLAGVKSSVS